MIYRDIVLNFSPQQDFDDALYRAAAARTGCNIPDITEVRVIKKSIDARHGKIKLNVKCDIYCGELPAKSSDEDCLPVWKHADGKKCVAIIGVGPAGLFAALRLLEAGIKPVLIERGKRTIERIADVQKIDSGTGIDANSNYCFGEGGAGAFSDGKLYTRSNKRGNIAKILQILCKFGADKKILTDAHPHIGSDKLPEIITRLTDTILELGGEAYFSHFCESFIIDSAPKEANSGRTKKIRALCIVDVKSGEKKILGCDALILACGHSSFETYRMLANISTDYCGGGAALLEAKAFALGVRIEHPRALIDSIQYKTASSGMAAAEYALKTQIDGRGVYSFCMCPGGRVVMSASKSAHSCVNGVSLSERESPWSNAAIVTEVRPEDVVSEDVVSRSDAFSLLDFRQKLEADFYAASAKYASFALPAQRLTDFINGKLSAALPETSYQAGVFSARIDLLLPNFVSARLKKAFAEFDKQMRSFVCPETLVIGIETSTSSCVRILRDAEHESPVIAGLFPAGEGAGYAGGIISSALDGEKTAGCIVSRFCATIQE